MIGPDGESLTVGDKIRLWNSCYGIVVCSIDTDDYMPAYPKAEWGYLQSGILIKIDNGGLFHYIEADEDIEIVEKANAKAA
jgi:hypothetical protein